MSVRESKLTFWGWFVTSIIMYIPIFNIAYIVFTRFSKTPELRRYGAAALVPAIIYSIIFILVILRFINMNYGDYMKFYELFHRL